MNDQQTRYITLTGDPVHASLKDRLIHRSEIQAGALFTAFTTAVSSQGSFTHMATLTGIAGLGAVLAAGFAAFSKRFQIKDCFGDAASDLCIDKNPDNNTPPTSPANMQRAEELREWNTLPAFGMPIAIALHAPILVIPMVNYMATGKAAAPAMMQILAGIFSFAVTIGASAMSQRQNFNNVVNRKWVITETPKPIRQEEKAPANTNIVPQP